MTTAFIFPGQGSQYVGMGADWYRISAEARVLCDQANIQLGYDLTELCFHGPDHKLNQTLYTQPAVFVTTLAMWRAAYAKLPKPDFVAGHSLGEFAALVAAGALEFSSALSLVVTRGRLMDVAGESAPGGMAVVLGASAETVQALCADVAQQTGAILVVANDNCPGQIVISGALTALDMAETLSKTHGIRRMRRLAVSVAPHSPLMAQVEAEFGALLLDTPIQTPHTPVVMNATATPVSDPQEIRQALLRQLTSPVRWRESVLWMSAQDVTYFVEIGPKNVLSGLVKRTLKGVSIESLDSVLVESWLTSTTINEVIA